MAESKNQPQAAEEQAGSAAQDPLFAALSLTVGSTPVFLSAVQSTLALRQDLSNASPDVTIFEIGATSADESVSFNVSLESSAALGPLRRQGYWSLGESAADGAHLTFTRDNKTYLPISGELYVEQMDTGVVRGRLRAQVSSVQGDDEQLPVSVTFNVSPVLQCLEPVVLAGMGLKAWTTQKYTQAECASAMFRRSI